ncbi:efflux RND transporter periplasmic adaptor subunit [Rhizobium puerariae]|uniref:Efflux RND transporter periplasmic adaptor subunit n=1 Tax=Rhizobium puerariae TaxID=1585791 RepID=A0ABV6AL14_9HYPH
MKHIWIFAGILVVAGVAGWEFRDRLPFLASAAQHASADKASDQAQNQRRRGGGAPPAVKTIAAARSALPMDVTAAGSAIADETTTIAAQEQGLVTGIAATDGATVKAGDLIAKLDDRTAKAALAKDQALLVRDQATLTQAETALQRANDLVRRNAGTQQAADEARAARDTAAATVESDKAAIAADGIVVEHTDIRAPFDGRLGDIDISTGAYLSTGSAVVTIAKYDPIYVKFHLSEAYLGQLKQGFGTGSIAVDAVPQNGGTASTGTLSFFDNTVDPASGTILAKARFDNPSGTLWPGQSLNVTVHFDSGKMDIVVPTVAVNPGADSPFVYAVGDDRKVHVTPVKVARSNGSDTAIADGLAEGAHVVVEGQVQLVDGAAVTEEFTGGKASGTTSAKGRDNGGDRPVEVGAAR